MGLPATLKSPALAEIMKPLDRLVAEARESHHEATAGYEAEDAAVEAMKAALKDEIKRAAKAASKPNGDRSTLHNLIACQRDIAAPEEPPEKRYKTEDPTVEKLAELLKDNPRGILVHRDELSGWLRGGVTVMRR